MINRYVCILLLSAFSCLLQSYLQHFVCGPESVMWWHLDYFSSISVPLMSVLQESEWDTDFVTEILNKLMELELPNERALIKN